MMRALHSINDYLTHSRLDRQPIAFAGALLIAGLAAASGCHNSTFRPGVHSDRYAQERRAHEKAVLEHFEEVNAQIESSLQEMDRQLKELAKPLKIEP